MKYILPFLLCVVFLVSACGSAADEDTVYIPILMYHDFSSDDAADRPFSIPVSRFDEHLSALENTGYRTVTFADLIDYVYFGGDLPDLPVLITADDGYTGVTELAASCAAGHGMTLSCAVIGALAGRNGHFSFDTPLPANMEIVSHTFALHDTSGWNGVLCPETELPLYETLLTEDCARMKRVCGDKFPLTASVFVYPHGAYSAESERLLRSLGYAVTVTCDPGIAAVRKGEPDSLYALPRISVWSGTTAKELLEMIEIPKK